jgi:hypothetical protein
VIAILGLLLRTPPRWLRHLLRWLTGLTPLLLLLWLYTAPQIGPNYTCWATNASTDRVGRLLLPWCNWQPLLPNEKSTAE